MLIGTWSSAQNLPELTPITLGTFSASSQMSVTNNDPGINSSYSIVGGGNELWGNVDKGQFSYYETSGDFDVRVRVESLEQVHRYAKTGLIVREGLHSTNRMVSVFATPEGPTALPSNEPVGANNVEFNFRRALNDGMNNIDLGPPGFPNAWLRLARRGSVFYGLIGRDGTNWSSSASVDTALWPGGSFASNVFLGLGTSSHEDTRTVRSELRDFTPVTSVAPVAFTRQPANAYALLGQSATFSAAVGDPVDAQYQWHAGGTPIPGATNATYTTARVTETDDKKVYHLTVTGPSGIATSSNVVLSVVSIEPPANPIAIYDFNDGEIPFGTVVFGTALVDPTIGFGGGGGLMLTTNRNDQNGSFVIEDLNPGSPVDSFTIAFKMKIGPGSANPADGVSLSFGPNIPNGTFVAPQQGVGPGLAISFDIYDNAVPTEGPAIDVFYGVDPSMVPQNFTGNLLHYPLSKARLVNSRYVDVIVRMNKDGKLDLVYDGIVIAYQLQTPFVATTGGRFGFGAYSGGQNALQLIDEISIETTTQTTDAYLRSLGPLGNAVPASTEIVGELIDLATLVDPASIRLSFNGNPVAPDVSKEFDLTTVRYAVPGLLAPNSTNTAVLVWSDNGSPATVHTNTISFKVANYATLPATLALPPGSGDPADPGFNVRVFQIEDTLEATSSAAETVLAGGGGANVADLTAAGAGGVFVDPDLTSMIDYDVNPGPTGMSFPGLPGTTGSRENFAAEVTTYIEFPAAGYHQMAIRSDDGFMLTAGLAGDPNAVQVGVFEGAREPLDTIFGFQVPQAGVYPFRLLYYQAGGGAMLRWSSYTPDGRPIRVNDLEQADVLRAYRSVTTTNQPAAVSISAEGGDLVISWQSTGVLESATEINGQWSPVQGASSPYRVSPSGTRFYRVRQ